MNLRENINRLLSEIKVNNPNIFFRSTGEIIDEDEDTLWTEVVPRWDNSRKIYTDYGKDNNYTNVTLSIYGEDESDIAYVINFKKQLKKYRIPYKVGEDFTSSHPEREDDEFFTIYINKKYFDLPK